jgi:hypothetical protein
MLLRLGLSIEEFDDHRFVWDLADSYQCLHSSASRTLDMPIELQNRFGGHFNKGSV